MTAPDPATELAAIDAQIADLYARRQRIAVLAEAPQRIAALAAEHEAAVAWLGAAPTDYPLGYTPTTLDDGSTPA